MPEPRVVDEVTGWAVGSFIPLQWTWSTWQRTKSMIGIPFFVVVDLMYINLGAEEED